MKKKEVLGLWIGESEGAKFWLQVFSELKNRGIEDIFISCIDGLKGLSDAIYGCTDTIDKINPKLLWSHIAHSRAGGLAFRAIQGMNEDQRVLMKKHLVYFGVAGSKPMPEDGKRCTGGNFHYHQSNEKEELLDFHVKPYEEAYKIVVIEKNLRNRRLLVYVFNRLGF